MRSFQYFCEYRRQQTFYLSIVSNKNKFIIINAVNQLMLNHQEYQ